MDIAGLFASLQQLPASYGDFIIEKIESNHMLDDVLPVEKCRLPYLLVTKECEMKTQSVFENEDESVDGSPLRLQEFDIPQAFVNEKGQAYSAVPISDARHIVSMYTLGLQGTETLKERLPMWVLCDDSSVIALGVEVEQDSDNCSVSSLVVTVKHPVDKTFNFHNIIKRHIAENGHNLRQSCKATYSVLRPMSMNISGNGEQGSLMIHLNWKNCTSLLQIPPPDAKCHVSAVVGNGDIRSPAHFMFVEIGVIQRIANGIQNNNMEWEMHDKDQESMSIAEQTKELISNVKLINITSANNEKTEETVSSPLKNIFLVRRKNLDFTEQLWNILKHCGSYSELHECLSYVLTSLQQGNYQPMLHRANKSQLAGFIRDSFSKKMVMPKLSGLLPLELLLEIGIGKIQRDYLSQMVSQELVTAADLDYLLAHNVDMFEQCHRLGKLHIVLELVVMLEQYLMLPSEVLRSVARKALMQVTNIDAPESEYTFPVSAQCLSSQLSELHPNTWSLCLESSGVCSVYFLSPSCPLDHVQTPVNKTEDDSDIDSKPKFILTVVREHRIAL